MSDSVPALSVEANPSVGSKPSVKEVLKCLVSNVGENGGDPFPILDRIWDIYAGKGIRTVFLTVGSSKSALADLEIAESLGCPLNIVPLSENERASWTEVLGILKERKREPTASAFSQGAESKWILPKNVRLQEAVPWWENGSIDVSGNVLKTQNVESLMASIATVMKLKDNANRIDILKIDAGAMPGLEKAILGAVLSAGYRPAIVLVRWSKMPDVDLSTTLAAGHLENSGYSLVGKVDNKFAYYFTDEDLYQICSWEGITGTNPVMTEIIQAAKNPRFHSSTKTEVV